MRLLQRPLVVLAKLVSGDADASEEGFEGDPMAFSHDLS